MSANTYPDNWQMISYRARLRAGNRCVRCGHPDGDPCDQRCRHKQDDRRRMLTVHHLDGDKANCKPYNMAPLCQICHLFIQSAYTPGQLTLGGGVYEEWLKPFEAGRRRAARRALVTGENHAS